MAVCVTDLRFDLCMFGSHGCLSDEDVEGQELVRTAAPLTNGCNHITFLFKYFPVESETLQVVTAHWLDLHL